MATEVAGVLETFLVVVLEFEALCKPLYLLFISTGELIYAKTTGWISAKPGGRTVNGPRANALSFSADPTFLIEGDCWILVEVCALRTAIKSFTEEEEPKVECLKNKVSESSS